MLIRKTMIAAIATGLMINTAALMTVSAAEEAQTEEQEMNRLEEIEQVTFETLNLDGETITDDIFSEKDITVLNFWATFCNPCISEMPDLAKWEEELPENVQILYVCCDVNSEEDADLELAELITDYSGIDPKHVLLGMPGSFSSLTSMLSAVPMTFFVDQDGYCVENFIVGAYIDGYKEVVDRILNN